MLGHKIRPSFQSNDLPIQILVGCSFGLLSAIASLRFSPVFVFGMLIAVIFLYASLKKPEIALMGILIATSSILYEEKLPQFSIGIGSLHIPDLLLLWLLGLIVLRWLLEPDFKIVHTPLDKPLLIFYGVTLLSTFIALGRSSVEIEPARQGIRVLSYYLTFFIVTNLVRERRQINFLLNSLFSLATVVAVAMLAQFLLGSSFQILPGSVENLRTQSTLYEGVTRIFPPGWSIILVSFVANICALILDRIKKFRWLKFTQCGLLGIAILLTFLRSYWAALILVYFILLYIFRGRERASLIRWSLVSLCSAAMIMMIILLNPSSRATKLKDATINRLSTIFQGKTYKGQDNSLNWRKIENGYAISAIASHPLIGLGMGARYRPFDSRLVARGGSDLSAFIHNGHLWILLQSGVLGYLSLFWLSIVFLTRGFRNWRNITNDRMRGVVLGFTLVFLALMIAAVVNSTFMRWYWTPVIGIIMGINEVILKNYPGKK
jgi:O-antigen ligase